LHDSCRSSSSSQTALEHGEIIIDKLSLAVKRADFMNRHLEQQLAGIEEDLKPLHRLHSEGK